MTTPIHRHRPASDDPDGILVGEITDQLSALDMRGGRRWVVIGAIVFLTFLISLPFLLRLRAQTATFVAIDTSSGTISGSSQSVADSSAAGGYYIKFVTAPTPTVAPTPAPTPSPTGAPSSGQSCPAYPSYPDANCTGPIAGTSLTPMSGSKTLSTANQVLQDFDLSGDITVQASNVTIKNCKIHGSGFYGVRVISGNLTIQDCEIYGFSEAAVAFDNWKGYRLDIHGMQSDGVKFGSNVTLEDSYLHDFSVAPGAHADGGQMQSGESNIVIRHNNFASTYTNANSSIIMAPDLGPNGSGPVTIDSNKFAGGNYTVYIVDGNNGQYHQKGYTVIHNRWVKNSYTFGPLSCNEPSSSFTLWSDNRYTDGTGELTC